MLLNAFTVYFSALYLRHLIGRPVDTCHVEGGREKKGKKRRRCIMGVLMRLDGKQLGIDKCATYVDVQLNNNGNISWLSKPTRQRKGSVE